MPGAAGGRRRYQNRGRIGRTRKTGQGYRARPRNGRYRNRGMLRPSVGRPIQAPLVHRKINTDALTALPAIPAGQPNAGKVVPFKVNIPDGSWAEYSRGFDISQTTGSAIRSKNVTCRLNIQFPDTTNQAVPYNIRIIQGFCKLPVQATIDSVSGISGAYDGVAVLGTGMAPVTPSTLFTDHVLGVVNDSLGTTNGLANVLGNVSTEQVQVLSDRSHTIEASAVSDAATFFPQMLKQYNWNTNTRMRLYPFVTDDDASSYAGEALTPVNNPGLYIPFLAVCVTNFEQITASTSAPKVGMVWTHYWNDAA